MEQVSIDKGSGLPEVWQTYQTIINAAEGAEVSDVTVLLQYLMYATESLLNHIKLFCALLMFVL